MTAPVWNNPSWRESGRQVKIGPLDGRLALFLILFLLFPGKFMFYLMLIALAFFYALDYKGYTLPNAYRKIQTTMAGKKRSGVHYWRQNKFRY